MISNDVEEQNRVTVELIVAIHKHYPSDCPPKILLIKSSTHSDLGFAALTRRDPTLAIKQFTLVKNVLGMLDYNDRHPKMIEIQSYIEEAKAMLSNENNASINEANLQRKREQ